jgi:hypothetical protein
MAVGVDVGDAIADGAVRFEDAGLGVRLLLDEFEGMGCVLSAGALFSCSGSGLFSPAGPCGAPYRIWSRAGDRQVSLCGIKDRQ